jgi:DNA polymerase III subunit delta
MIPYNPCKSEKNIFETQPDWSSAFRRFSKTPSNDLPTHFAPPRPRKRGTPNSAPNNSIEFPPILPHNTSMPKRVIALVGPDIFLQLESLRAIMEQLPKDTTRITIDGETAKIGDVLDELRSYAMFSSSKCVVIRSADDFISNYRPQMEDYVESPAEDSILVLRMNSLPKNQRIYKLIDKHGAIFDCQTPKDVLTWLVKHAKEVHNLILPLEASDLLVDRIGADLGRLDNELAKLALTCETGKVDAEFIKNSIAFQREQEMWDMTDELAAGRTANCLQRWRHLVRLDSSAEYRAITWLTIWLEKVLNYFAMKDRGMNEFTIGRELKIWPTDKQKPFFQNANALGKPRAQELVKLLAQLDYRSKTGLGETTQNVERFILLAR